MTGNPACTTSPSITLAGVVVVEYSGLDQNNPLDSVSAGYSTSGNQTNLLDSGNAAPANSNLLVFAGGISNNGTTAAGTGFLSVQSHSLTGGGSAITEQNSSAISGNNVLQRATACIGCWNDVLSADRHGQLADADGGLPGRVMDGQRRMEPSTTRASSLR